ncbi:RNA polymerase sigma factor [Aporhodopirellula aestuarii]|uniref:Sigma-70 family RNA polymerase sigma factor n=1 Tax=Aporhodopirellula aestuarii TaxID=2950107 RepID=A0ABT0U131_9BACT|nr:sigma-70 family RNA polymerase sigma factor [Aporhodopirellula aestuarii]MCM2370344.1 sigma-70 family RNA polymerase sigma factor [Aporhodopirellula aestuarii]
MNTQTRHPPIPSSRSSVQPPPVVSARESMFAQLSDRDLLDGWRKDQSRLAFDELVCRYRVMVLSVCRRHCQNEQDADDAFQTTWVCLAQTANQIRHPERLVGWLHRVATRASRLTVQQRRGSSHAKTRRCSMDAIELHEIPDQQTDTFAELTRRHEAAVVDEELAELPEHYRTAIVMHLMEGHSYQTIAQRIESTVGAVRGHVQRGKQVLAGRLRRRGVVPVMAFAAAQTLRVSESVAANVTQQSIPADIELSTAQPAIDSEDGKLPFDLTPLLSSGNSMLRLTSWTAAGCLASAAVVSIWLTQVSAFGENEARPLTVRVSEIPSGNADTGALVVGQIAAPASTKSPTKNDSSPSTTPLAKEPVPETAPEHRTEVARIVAEKMDDLVSINLKSPVSNLDESLSDALGVAVLLDHRAVALTDILDDGTVIEISTEKQPLRTILRKTLEPHGLRAEVQDEGLVITADFSELTRRGISTDKWIGISDELVEQVDNVLAEKIAVDFVETPLMEAVAIIARETKFPIRINLVALEEIGLTEDTPVEFYSGISSAPESTSVFGPSNDPFGPSSTEPSKTSQPQPSIRRLKAIESKPPVDESRSTPVRVILNSILRPLELTYTVRDEAIIITTLEAAQADLRPRIYFLEGTGLPRGDYNVAINLIQASLATDQWESLGGTSTIMPMGSGTQGRPALLISTTTAVHDQIESLMQSMRETHFGPDPVSTEPSLPRVVPRAGSGGGGSGGGMF